MHILVLQKIYITYKWISISWGCMLRNFYWWGAWWKQLWRPL